MQHGLNDVPAKKRSATGALLALAIFLLIGFATLTFLVVRDYFSDESTQIRSASNTGLVGDLFSKDSNIDSPDATLEKIYALLSKGQNREALLAAQELINEFPNFQLGQLVYADLLRAQTGPLQNFGDASQVQLESASTARSSPLPSKEPTLTGQDVRQKLQAEFLARKIASSRPPLPNHVPFGVAKLSKPFRYFLAIDVSKSRLYLFGNEGGKLHFIKDYYMSVGRLGAGKQVEGDEKTPLGLYFVKGRIEPKTLQSVYGAAALPLNYPGPYDQLVGRTGSGIWLHGTPAEQFSRFPLSSNGCVVLSNPDISELERLLAPRTTPILISQSINWTPQEDAVKIGQRLSDEIPIDAQDSTLIHWQDGKTELIYSLFGDAGKSMNTFKGPFTEQYWRKNSNGKWQLFFEGKRI